MFPFLTLFVAPDLARFHTLRQNIPTPNSSSHFPTRAYSGSVSNWFPSLAAPRSLSKYRSKALPAPSFPSRKISASTSPCGGILRPRSSYCSRRNRHVDKMVFGRAESVDVDCILYPRREDEVDEACVVVLLGPFGDDQRRCLESTVDAVATVSKSDRYYEWCGFHGQETPWYKLGERQQPPQVFPCVGSYDVRTWDIIRCG